MKHKLLLPIFCFAFAFNPVFGATTEPIRQAVEGYEKKTASRRIDSAAKSSLALGVTTVLALAVSPVLAICLGCSAFIYGRQAARHIRANPNDLRGKRMAEAGMVIGSIANPIGVFFLGAWLIADELKKLFRHPKRSR